MAFNTPQFNSGGLAPRGWYIHHESNSGHLVISNPIGKFVKTMVSGNSWISRGGSAYACGPDYMKGTWSCTVDGLVARAILRASTAGAAPTDGTGDLIVLSGGDNVVRNLDRLGRSVRDLITLVSELQERGIHFRSLTDSIDTSTPAGRFFFHVMSALAEMERELIVERTRAGLAAAREQGRIGGRRRIMTTEVVERCRRMLENGATRQQIADVIGVGVKTIYKYLPVTG